MKYLPEENEIGLLSVSFLSKIPHFQLENIFIHFVKEKVSEVNSWNFRYFKYLSCFYFNVAIRVLLRKTSHDFMSVTLKIKITSYIKRYLENCLI